MMIGERSLPLRSAKRCSYGLLLLGAGVFGTPVAADPLEDYRQACKAPLYDILSEVPYPDLAESRALGDASWAAAERSCAAFAEGLAATEPSAEARLALYLARRMLGEVRYDDPEACAEIEEIAKVLPAHADALVALAVCTHATEEYMPLLQKALEINPSHHDALVYVTTMATHTGDYYGTDPSTLASYGEALYEATGYVNDRFLAAKAIYKAAKDVGDFAAKESIRVRLRRDLGLDALDYSPARRDGSLQRACADQLFELGLEKPCVSTLVAFASEAVTTGTPIPDDVLGHVDFAFENLERGSLAAARLRALLVAFPGSLPSSEHHRVLARNAEGREDRMASLRRAVDLDPGNLQARCDLAEELVGTTEGLDEGRSLYLDLTTDSGAPCNPLDMVRSMDIHPGEAMEIIHLGK